MGNQIIIIIIIILKKKKVIINSFPFVYVFDFWRVVLFIIFSSLITGRPLILRLKRFSNIGTLILGLEKVIIIISEKKKESRKSCYIW